jgi:glycosyltransferase involved in cell wall biosynthesis
MLITVAICTYNRAESLRRTLESLVAMRVPEAVKWEVVVINNNSTDHTDAVIGAFADRLPIRGELETRPGKSNACNRAIDAAKGDYFVWTDDDVIVDPDWLSAYADAFRRRPQAAFFGGPIRPRFEEPSVKWAMDSQGFLGGPYAIRDLGDEAVLLSSEGNRLPLGANMGIRGIEQRAFRYNPELGPGTGLGRERRGEEHDLVERIMRAGGVGYPVPAARVEHCIGRDRQTVGYLTRYFAGAGDQDAYLEHHAGKQQAVLFGAPQWLWRALIEGWLLYHFYRLIAPGPVWVHHLKTYAYAFGAIRYWRNEGKKERDSARLL